MKKYQLIAVVLVIIALLTQVGFSSVSGKMPTIGNPDRLTPEQMKNAIVVPNGLVDHRPKGKGLVYRLENCDDTDPDSACYFMIGDGNGSAEEASAISNNASSIVPLSTSATITCGITIYDTFGIAGATLKENIGVTFWGTYGQTPVTLNWGDLRGTSAYHVGWSWTSFSGPTPSPGWGVYVSRTGSAYATAGGNLYRSAGGQGTSTYVTVRLTIRSAGWYCS